MQEIALVLRSILALQEPRPVGSRVVTGGDLLRAEPHGMVEERLELDLGVAQHVGIWRAPGRVLAQEFGEHPVLVLGGEVHRLEIDADHVRRRGGRDRVLAGRLIYVVMYDLPILNATDADRMAL